MAIEYDDIQLKISSVLDSTKGLDKAVERLDSTKSALDGLAKTDISNTTKEVKEFAEAVESVKPTTLDLARKAANKYRHAWHNGRSPQNGRTETLEGNYASSATAMFGDANEEIGKATKSLQYYKDIVNDIKRSSQETSAFKKMGETIKDSFDKAKESISSVFSSLDGIIGRFGRLITYRIMRAIITGFVSGMKEGLKNLEDWDRATNMSGFANSMDRARESLLVLKNSLAVIVAPGLEALIGVLQKVATWAMTAANAISRFFAILGGKSTYTAVVWADTLADSEKKAGGAAKKTTDEFKKQLMAFDEINNITAQNQGGSGGGGGGGSSAKYSDMFEEREVGNVSDIESKLKGVFDWLKKIADFLAKGFQPLLKIKDTVASVWEKIKETASLLASAFKSPLETIAFGFRNIIHSVSSLFESIVSFAGSVLKSILKIIDAVIIVGKEFGIWDTLGRSIKQVFDIVAAAIEVVAYWIKTAGYYLEYVATLAGEAWHLIMGKGSIEEFKRNMAIAKAELDGKVLKATQDLGNALNNVFNRKYYLKTVWDEIINRTIHVNEISSKITGSGYTRDYKYASGGYVNSGQLFVARESGPELVGNLGGKTGVVNNEQIVESVSRGVAEAVSSVLGGGSNVTVTLEGDAKGLFKVVQKEGRAYSARTGQPALA